MNQNNQKEKKFEENFPVTQATTSTNFSKKNKMQYYKTFSTNFSDEQNMKEKTNKNKSRNNPKIQILSSVKKQRIKPINSSSMSNILNIKETPKKKKNKSIVNQNLAQKKEYEKNKDFSIKNNSLLPTNINLYQHLIRGKDFGIYENLNWTLRLRDYSHKGINDTKVIDYKDYYYRENQQPNNIKLEKMKLTENFNPPSYYDEDLKKYKKRIQMSTRSIISQLNPNYNKIKHLLFGNNFGNINLSQFQFETTLRNLKKSTNNANKKWEVLPKVKNDKFKVKFLSPCTPQGIENLKKIEKYIHKNYDYNYEMALVGNDKIKKKKLFNNRNYTISGIGETLGDEKYNNHFGDNNMFANKRILSTASNTQCKFELGLRLYGPYTNRKNLTRTNFRPKKNKIKNYLK